MAKVLLLICVCIMFFPSDMTASNVTFVGDVTEVVEVEEEQAAEACVCQCDEQRRVLFARKPVRSLVRSLFRGKSR